MSDDEAFTRKREDRRSSVARAKRRLDSLALLLEGDVVCVAVAIIDSKLHIAANGIDESHPKAKTQEFIRQVLGFLRDIVESDQTRGIEEIFATIIGKRADVSVAIANAIVPYVLAGDGSVSVAHVLKKHKELSVDKISRAIGWASILFNDLKKQVSFLKTKPEALELVQAFQQPPIIIDDGGENVHAEMRLLGIVVRQIHEEKIKRGDVLYIGISRLCCLKCACMLKAAQEQLATLEIVLQFPGEHDLEKHWAWNSPAGFPPGIFERADLNSDPTLIVNIVQQARAIYEQKIQTKEVRGTKQERDLSDSSGDEVEPQLEHLQYLTKKLAAFKAEKKAVGDSETLQQNISMVQLGLLLHETEVFKSLFLKSPPSAVESAQIFDSLVSQIFTESPILVADRINLFRFLKTPEFAGRILINYFASLDESVLSMHPTLPSEEVPSIGERFEAVGVAY